MKKKSIFLQLDTIISMDDENNDDEDEEQSESKTQSDDDFLKPIKKTFSINPISPLYYCLTIRCSTVGEVEKWVSQIQLHIQREFGEDLDVRRKGHSSDPEDELEEPPQDPL